MEKTVESSKP